jgi:hypothetical protein
LISGKSIRAVRVIRGGKILLPCLFVKRN